MFLGLSRGQALAQATEGTASLRRECGSHVLLPEVCVGVLGSEAFCLAFREELGYILAKNLCITIGDFSPVSRCISLRAAVKSLSRFYSLSSIFECQILADIIS